MKPVLFTIGPLTVFSYGVILMFSMLAALFIMWRLFKNNLSFLRFKVTLDLFFDSIFVFVFSFGLGARLLHIVEHWDVFGGNLFLWLLFLHYPGFSFLGGVAGGAFGLWLFCRHRKLGFLLLLDLMAVGLSLTVAFSRIGSLLHGDSFGKETSFFLKVAIDGLSGMRHPTQLYEAIIFFGLFAWIYFLYTRGKTPTGELFLYFLLASSTARFFIEILRGDSVYLGGVAVAQIISAFFIVMSLSIFVIRYRKHLIAYAAKAGGIVRLIVRRNHI